jgi:hypothetical protein
MGGKVCKRQKKGPLNSKKKSRNNSRRYSELYRPGYDHADDIFYEPAYEHDIIPKFYSDIDRLNYFNPNCYPDSYLTRPKTLPLTPFEAEELRRAGYIYKPACVPQCRRVLNQRRCYEI